MKMKNIIEQYKDKIEPGSQVVIFANSSEYMYELEDLYKYNELEVRVNYIKSEKLLIITVDNENLDKFYEMRHEGDSLKVKDVMARLKDKLHNDTEIEIGGSINVFDRVNQKTVHIYDDLELIDYIFYDDEDNTLCLIARDEDLEEF